ncbi:MAG: methionine synthase, partial [Chloroflexota bacterium]
MLLEAATDIVNFDAYGFAQNFALYPAEVEAFLKRGGVIAWGIVPNTEQAVLQETAGSLRDRLEEAM